MFISLVFFIIIFYAPLPHPLVNMEYALWPMIRHKSTVNWAQTDTCPAIWTHKLAIMVKTPMYNQWWIMGGGSGIELGSSDTQFGSMIKFSKWRGYLVKFMDETMERKHLFICINFFIHFSYSDLFIYLSWLYWLFIYIFFSFLGGGVSFSLV